MKNKIRFSLTREVVNVNDIKLISGPMFSDNIQIEQP